MLRRRGRLRLKGRPSCHEAGRSMPVLNVREHGIMLKSTIIEVDGIFVGAAILVDGFAARRFYAAHDKVRSLHNATLPDLAVLMRTVTRQFRAGQGGPAAA